MSLEGKDKEDESKDKSLVLAHVKEKEKSMIELNENNKSMTSNGDPDYQHSLSPTSKVKLRAEIFIQLKQGSFDSSYMIGELLGEGQVSCLKIIF